MVNDLKLDDEEKEILDSVERGEWKSVHAVKERLAEYQAAATATLESDGLISVALPPEDLKALKQRAQAAGVSSQKMIANIVHQFLGGA